MSVIITAILAGLSALWKKLTSGSKEIHVEKSKKVRINTKKRSKLLSSNCCNKTVMVELELSKTEADESNQIDIDSLIGLI